MGKTLWIALLWLLTACQGGEIPTTLGDLTPAAESSPVITATLPPFPTLTATSTFIISTPYPTPTLLPSPVILTPALLSDERLGFVVSTLNDPVYHDSVIAFADGDGTALEFPDLLEPFRLTGVSTWYLAFSPDGQYLAFDGANEKYGCGPGTGDCYTTNYGTFLLDYSEGAIVAHIEGTLTNPSWAPDSRYLVVSIREGPLCSTGGKSLIGDLFVIDIQSGQRIQLTNHPSSDLYPAWSPDGQWVAFVRFDPYQPGCSPLPRIDHENAICNQASLYVIRPDGSDLRLLLEPIFIQAPIGGRDDWPYNAPAWSPDSQWLAVLVGDRRSTIPIFQDIVLVNANDGEVRILTDNKIRMDIYPTWSPDGSQLAFVSDRDSNWEIYRMSPDGTGVINLTQSPADEYAPVWSPDGQRIAFLSNRGTDNFWNYKLYIMNADGTNQVLVNGNYEFVISKPTWLPTKRP